MKKFKAKKSISKRVAKITGKKKLMRLTMSVRHLARKKSKRSRNKSSTLKVLTPGNAQRIKKILGV